MRSIDHPAAAAILIGLGILYTVVQRLWNEWLGGGE